MPRKAGQTSATREKRLREIEALILEAVPVREVERVIAAKHRRTEDMIHRDIQELERRWQKDGTSGEKLILLNLVRRATTAGKVGQALAALRAARKGEPTPASKAIVAYYQKLGKPPDGSGEGGRLEYFAWAAAAGTKMLYRLLIDPTITDEGEREARGTKLLRAIAGVKPETEIFDALERIRRSQDDLEDDEDPEVKPRGKQSPSPLRSDES